jgi:hypothetical protein
LVLLDGMTDKSENAAAFRYSGQVDSALAAGGNLTGESQRLAIARLAKAVS